MRLKTLFLSVLVSFLLLVGLASAAFTVSVDVSKSLTENEQAIVTVTVTNPSGGSTESNIVTTLSSSTSWFSVVTACNAISSLSAAQSSTSTCIIKPISTGGDLTLTATSESSGGTTGSNSATGINIAAQTSSLSASLTADSSVSTSATFYVGVTVTAPSANDVVNARATISESGQCTVDTSYVPATQSLGNITKGTSKSPTNWKLTASSASGTCTVTINIVSDVGGTASPSKSITVGTSGGSSGSSSSTGGGGGGGGGAAATKTTVTITEKGAKISIPSITAKSVSDVLISSPELLLTKLKIKVVNTVSNVQVTTTKLDSRPGSVVSDAPGVVNQYFDISYANISAGDIEKVTFDFSVKKSWISENSIDANTVALYRYKNDQWSKLNTVKTGENSENISYNTTSDGLSVFAITGETTQAATTTTSTLPSVTTSTTLPLGELKQTYLLYVTLALLALLVVIVVVYFRKSKGKKTVLSGQAVM